MVSSLKKSMTTTVNNNNKNSKLIIYLFFWPDTRINLPKYLPTYMKLVVINNSPAWDTSMILSKLAALLNAVQS